MKNLLILMIFLGTGMSYAQTFDDLLQNYIGNNKEKYLQPVADLVTGSFNSGWNSPGKMDSSFYFRFGITTTAGFVTDNLKTFRATTEDPFLPMTTVDAATIVGNNEPVVVDGENGTSYVFQGGTQLALFPMVMPQINVGGLYGSELGLRFFAWDFGGDFGKLQLLGLSAKHDVGRYFKLGKWYWNAMYAFQNIQGGKYFDITTHLVGMEAGRTIGPWYWYGTLGYQFGKMDAVYKEDPDQGEREVSVSLNNSFPVYAGLGGGVRVGVLRVNLALNYAKAPFGELGIGIQF